MLTCRAKQDDVSSLLFVFRQYPISDPKNLFLEMDSRFEVVGKLAGPSIFRLRFGGKFEFDFFIFVGRRGQRVGPENVQTESGNSHVGKIIDSLPFWYSRLFVVPSFLVILSAVLSCSNLT